MCDPGKNQPVNIFKNLSKGFALLWGVGRKKRPDLPRCNLRKNRKRFYALLVVRNPIYDRMAPLPEFIRAHVIADFM